MSRTRSVTVCDILRGSCALRPTKCICGMLHGRSISLTTAPPRADQFIWRRTNPDQWNANLGGANEREPTLHLAKELSRQSRMAREAAGNRARKGAPIFEPRRHDRHKVEIKRSPKSPVARTQCARGEGQRFN